MRSDLWTLTKTFIVCHLALDRTERCRYTLQGRERVAGEPQVSACFGGSKNWRWEARIVDKKHCNCAASASTAANDGRGAATASAATGHAGAPAPRPASKKRAARALARGAGRGCFALRLCLPFLVGRACELSPLSRALPSAPGAARHRYVPPGVAGSGCWHLALVRKRLPHH